MKYINRVLNRIKRKPKTVKGHVAVGGGGGEEVVDGQMDFSVADASGLLVLLEDI